MSKYEFVLKLLGEGREWIKVILPPLIAFHLPTPAYMKKKND